MKYFKSLPLQLFPKTFWTKSALKEFRRFCRARSGVIAVVFAIAAIPIFTSVGAGFDYARAQILKTRLGEALDKAALAAGSLANPSDTAIKETLDAYFAANFPEGIGSRTSISHSYDEDTGEIKINATGSVQTAFLSLFNIDKIDVAVATVVVRETSGLEVALVLDNTGSMSRNNRMVALRSAASELVDILFQDEDRPKNVTIGLVPYVTTVNIGKDNEEAFINVPTPPNSYPLSTDTEWKGCVEARQSPADVSDQFDPTSDLFGKWNPYYWESEPILDGRERFGGIFDVCVNTWWLPSFNQGFLANPVATGRSPNIIENYPQRSNPPRYRFLRTIPPSTRGPNQACPDPITALTNNRNTLKSAIRQMQPWSGNGTMTHLGAAWGWRVLSQQAPFTEGKPKGAGRNKKAVIIMTDGENFMTPGRSNCINFVNDKYTSHYTGYGYLSENRLGTTDSTRATQKLNEKLESVCRAIKNDEISVFTITFELDNIDTQNIFRECATKPSWYFNSPDAATLKDSFRAIGAQLNGLRITK